MNTLIEHVDDYLQIRRALGYKLEREGRLLPDFVAFLDRQGASHVTADLALHWAMLPANASPQWWVSRLSMVRRFAQHLSAFDGQTEVPSRDLIPQIKRRKLVPYVYTDGEVLTLMAATNSLSGLKAHTYTTLIGLLASTGMRVGETLALDCSDVDWRHGILVVRHSKFDKSREVPLHPTSVQALRAYSQARDRSFPQVSSPAFLLSLAGTRLNYKNVHYCFLRLLRQAGMADQQPRRPRLHDLRHTFAIRTLSRWYQDGVDVEARLPALSTYLGHVCPSQTYWYLTATPDLLKIASGRFEQSLGELP